MLSKEQISTLNNNKQELILSKRIERYQYLGLLSEYQLHPFLKVNSFQYTKLNKYQHFLFKRVLHGLKVYTPEEVNKLHWDKKRRITRVWKRAQKELNAWKQIICNKKVNSYLRQTFYKSKFALDMANVPAEETFDDYRNTMSFKDLGIKYEDIILKFMSVGLLPKNFFLLDLNENQ